MLLNNECFETLIQQCKADAFKSAGPVTAPQSFTSVGTVVPPWQDSELKTKLANVLAVLARQAHVIGNGASPNLYVSAMDQGVRELEAFAAVVYSSNFDSELLGAGSGSGSSGGTGTVPDSVSSSPIIVAQDDGELDHDRVARGVSTVPGFDNNDLEKAWGRAVEEQPGSGPAA